MSKVFISYAREDREFAQRLVNALKERGRDSWVDWEDIEPSDAWWKSVTEAIDAADAVVFLVSPDSLASTVCRQEVRHATERNKRLIAVVCRDVEGLSVPDEIAQINYLFMREGDNWADGLAGLERALDLNIEFVRIHTRVLTRAEAWQLSGRRPTPLLRGEELRAAEQWLAQAAAGAEPQPTSLQADFITASRQVASRRQRLAVAGALVVASVAIGLSIFALIQRSQARHQASLALSRQLAASAQADLASDPEQSIASAVRGVLVQPTLQATHALWQALVGSRLRAEFREPSAIESVAFSPDGGELAVGSADGAVRLWRVTDRRLLWTQGLGQPSATSLSFAHAGDVLAVGRSSSNVDGSSCSVGVLDAATGRLQRTLATQGGQGCSPLVAFVAPGHLLAVASEAGSVQLWNTDSGASVGSGTLLPADALPTVALAVSADGRLLALSGLHLVRVINLGTGANVATIDGAGQLFNPTGLMFSPDDRSLMVSGEYATEIYSLASRSGGVPTELYAQAGATLSPAWSSDDRMVAAVAGLIGVDVWDASTDRLIEVLHGASSRPFTGVTFSSHDLLAGGSSDGTVRIWAPDPDLPVRVTQPNVGPGWASYVPAAHLAVLGDARGIAVLKDDGMPVSALTMNSSGPIGVSDTGQLAFTKAGSVDEWQLPSGRAVRSWKLPFRSEPAAVAVGDGGKVAAAVGDDGELAVFSATRTLRVRVPAAPIVADNPPNIWMSPDGLLLAVAEPDGIQFLSTQNLRVVHSEAGSAVSFSPSGALVAIQRPDLSIDVLSTSDWAVQSTELGEPTQAAVSFSPDGRLVAATASDGIMRLWDDSDGTLLSSTQVVASALDASRNGISPPVLTQTGTAIVSSGGSVSVYVVCPSCLSPTVLLREAAQRTAQIKPVVAP